VRFELKLPRKQPWQTLYGEHVCSLARSSRARVYRYIWAAEHPGKKPTWAGSVGYSGDEGFYLKDSFARSVYNDTGTDLLWYSSWDLEWRAPAAFFQNSSSLTSDPLSCEDVRASWPGISYHDSYLTCKDGWWATDECTSRNREG
jgi:hypothetical protein